MLIRSRLLGTVSALPVCLAWSFAAVFVPACATSSSSSGTEQSGLSADPDSLVGIDGKCLDDSGDSTSNGNAIQLYTCNGTKAQSWTFANGTLVGPGGKCLDVTGANPANGTRLELWPCNGGTNQQWALTALENGEIVGLDGKCVTAHHNHGSDGTRLELDDCNGAAGQLWSRPGGANGAPDAGPPTARDGGSGGATTTDASTGADAGTDASTGGGSGGGSTDPTALSYMVGIKANTSPTGPAQVQSWLDRPMDVAGGTITTVSYYENAPWQNASGSKAPLMEMSFPLLTIFGEGADLTDMGEAASGAYDATYTQMAEALAGSSNQLLSVRIGWELNGNWYAWSNGVGPHATYANYVAAFKRAAAIVKAKNPQVLIQWNLAWGQEDPTPYWPGAYDASSNPGGVDVISMDFYQGDITTYNNGGQTSSWAIAQSGNGSSGPITLDWMVSFAQQQHVKIALSEYGAGSPSSNGLGSGHGLDDGTWTADSIKWIDSLPAGLFLWTMWSDDEPADDIVTPGANPSEQAAWVSAWKGTHFGGSWWTGTTP